MRASDGSHYLAFTAQPSAVMPLPAGPALLYVRLANATPARLGERSQIREWLAGTRTAPPPIARSGIAIGEMPIFGPTGNLASTTRQPTSSGMTDLALLDLERRRERAKEEERERQRRAELEGKAAAVAEVVPFEDFDLASRSIGASGARVISRALTTGPGDYVLYLAWADPSAPKPTSTIQVMKKSIRLPPASSDALTISSVILADGVQVRDTPYPASEQASHPYSIGVTEIAPAADAVFTSDENINIVFQVINPQPSERGKPDVEIASRIVRLTGIKAEPIASLKPLTYSAETMPAPFDLRLGHPVFVALTAPLETLGRGSYRLEIIVNDRNAGRSATSDVEFTVAATAKSLLGEAPALDVPVHEGVGPARRCADLRGEVVDAVIALAGAAARAGECRRGQVRRFDGRGTGRERRRGGPCRADGSCLPRVRRRVIGSAVPARRPARRPHRTRPPAVGRGESAARAR